MSEIDYKKVTQFGIPIALVAGLALGALVIAPMLEKQKTNSADKKTKTGAK